MSAIVEFRGVGYGVQQAAGSLEILRDLSFAVEPGETLVLLGRSGSGKTTALKLVNRLLEPGAGAVLVEGRATVEWDPIKLRRRIGYVIQETGLFPHFTVAQNVGLVPRLEGWTGGSHSRARGRAAGAHGPAARRVSGALSARAFRRTAAEGGSGAGAGGGPAAAALRRTVRRARPGDALRTAAAVSGAGGARFSKTSIFVTHDVREALMLGTRIALLHNGRLEMLAPPEEFMRARTKRHGRFWPAWIGEWRAMRHRSHQ